MEDISMHRELHRYYYMSHRYYYMSHRYEYVSHCYFLLRLGCDSNGLTDDLLGFPWLYHLL